ncbi:GNAT family N-acetyltransferase [Cohaesibacter sp. CAU 1516]|uniref:GNAT family N-acetyltransferase n=1 Tax=Cohaesibacter sp. CAU 1516 TaxID=2576038 RepID=UPI0010FD893F|nr:GNAT family N-acetyltransferase [Cohaesibacter sp. CAU 1516]TLP43132.1 GNAT family N-acetyltransferase [Cohaesibacter sp. CAU 1516]
MTEQSIIRAMTEEDVAELIGWAKAEGWNPGKADAAPFYAADRQGFLGHFVDGALVAGISCVTYGDDFSFIGLYITHPDQRGKGYGLKVWNAAMERLKGRMIGLDGVPQQQDNYASMGFAKAYETARWSGLCSFQKDERIYDVLEVDAEQLDEIATYDAQAFPAPRKAFLKAWLSPPRSAFAITREGKLAGYAVLRECEDGFKLGPLFADDEESALKLFGAASNACTGAMLHLDVPANQTSFSHILAARGFERGFETARMYKGGMPSLDMDRVFAISSLELG